jgi:hypothetical protein
MVEIGSIPDILINELTHPRPITLVLVVVSVLLLFAGVQSRMNRRRWAAQMSLIDAISDDQATAETDEEQQIPAPVTVLDSGHRTDRYDDEDVELV